MPFPIHRMRHHVVATAGPAFHAQFVKRRAILSPSQTLVHSSIDSSAPLPSHLSPRQIGRTIANGSCETHSQCDNKTSVPHDANRIMSYAWATVSNALPSLLPSRSQTHTTNRPLRHCKSMQQRPYLTRNLLQRLRCRPSLLAQTW